MTVTPTELLAVMGSRELRDGQTVFTGVGAPMLAAGLAQRLHAPGLTMVIEGGIIGPEWKPGWLPISTNEMRAAYRARMLPAITDLFLLAQRGFLDVGTPPDYADLRLVFEGSLDGSGAARATLPLPEAPGGFRLSVQGALFPHDRRPCNVILTAAFDVTAP